MIKMFFAVSNALLDASIAAWDCKAHYDYCRPDSVIRHVKDDEQFEAWGRPCREPSKWKGGLVSLYSNSAVRGVSFRAQHLQPCAC